MILILLLFQLANSEWAGYFHLNASQTKYNVTLVSHPRFFKHSSEVCYMTYNQTCNQKDSFFIFDIDFPIDTAKNISITQNATAVILILNGTTLWQSNIPAFAMSPGDGSSFLKELSSTNSTLSTIDYFYIYHCEEYWPLISTSILFVVIWLGIISMWCYNNHYANADHAQLFHKSSSVVILFKVLTTVAWFFETRNCPPTLLGNEVIGLLKKQTRSLYETSFFFLLILLSKGWSVSRNSISRKEMNYQLMYLVLIYIMDSAANIIGPVMNTIALMMYLSLFIHISLYCCSTIKSLFIQAEVINEARVLHLLPIVAKKKRIFYSFTVLCFFYFFGEFSIHILLSDSILDIDITWQMKYAMWNLAHEFMEVFIIGGILYLYRARNMGRFFSLDLLDSEEVQQLRIIPFYEANTEKSSEETGLIIFLQPESTLLVGKEIKMSKAIIETESIELQEI
ncbi:unnamed protein product [Blepharisma stoltei]|uniref:Intimal thickness related receptor IRP domain-containing protein n=1 Tax=Blepharisma stoltei TaxID=1481888 RepID=A0AAU9J8G0_9CILI|nr:unnamed protein product [Blepharisma stoltei]